MERDRPRNVEAQEDADRREAQLREWGTIIEKYEAQGERVGAADNVVAYYRELDRVRARHQVAQDELSQLRAADGDGWEATRAGVEDAFRELREAIDDLTFGAS